jgi:hypothetical protein
MEAALGGYEAIARLENLLVETDCSGPDGEFRTRIFSSRPDRVYFRQTSQRDTVEIWSTPDSTWTLTANGIAEPVPAAARAIVRGHEFHLLLFELERRFHEIAVSESSTDSVRLTMRDEFEQPAELILDATTWLPRQLTVNPDGAEGAVRIRFADWRHEGELLYFHALRLWEGSSRVFDYRYSSIRPNVVDGPDFRRTSY